MEKALPKASVVVKQAAKEKEKLNVDIKSKNSYFYVPLTNEVDLVDSLKSKVHSWIKATSF